MGSGGSFGCAHGRIWVRLLAGILLSDQLAPKAKKGRLRRKDGGPCEEEAIGGGGGQKEEEEEEEEEETEERV